MKSSKDKFQLKLIPTFKCRSTHAVFSLPICSIWALDCYVIVIHGILTLLNYEIHLHLNPYLSKPTDTPWLYLLQFSPICLMSCVFMCSDRIWVPMHMSTLKWATMSLVAPDDTPANEQLIQPMKFWTDTYLR